MFSRSMFRSVRSMAMDPLKLMARHFNAPAAMAVKQMPSRPTVKEEDIEETFLKGSGPGGQKINKTSSAVQLKHIPTGIVIKSQETRSRMQNRKIARRILAEKLEEMEKGPQSRRAVKAEVAKKKKASKSKKAKRKYRKLDEAKRATGIDGDEEIDNNEEVVGEPEELEQYLGGDGKLGSMGTRGPKTIHAATPSNPRL